MEPPIKVRRLYWCLMDCLFESTKKNSFLRRYKIFVADVTISPFSSRTLCFGVFDRSPGVHRPETRPSASSCMASLAQMMQHTLSAYAQTFLVSSKKSTRAQNNGLTPPSPYSSTLTRGAFLEEDQADNYTGAVYSFKCTYSASSYFYSFREPLE